MANAKRLALSSLCAVLLAVATVATPPTAVSYYNFRAFADAGRFLDSVGTNDGELINGPASNNGVLSFTAGDKQYGRVRHSDDFKLRQGTLAFWMLPSRSPKVEKGIVTKQSEDSPSGLKVVQLRNRVCATISGASDDYVLCTAEEAIAPDTWHHIAVSWGFAGYRLFLNGKLIKQKRFTGGIQKNTADVILGARNRDGQIKSYYIGQITDVLFASSQLKASELVSNRQETTTLPAEPTTTPQPTTRRPTTTTTTTTTGTTTPAPPLVICADDVTFNAAPGSMSTTAFWANPTPNVANTPIEFSSSSRPLNSSFPLGKSRVAVNVKSHNAGVIVSETRNNRVQECKLNVNVVDIEPPSISCPRRIITTTDPGTYTALVDWTIPTATDNSGDTVRVFTTHDPLARYPIGDTRVRVIAIDKSGNENVCSFLITVNDEEAPILDCPDTVLGITDPGEDQGRAVFRVTAEDNSFKEVSLSSTAQSGITKFPLGSSTVEFRGLDVFGNEATCFFTVVINDVEAPMITCPETVTVNTLPGKAVGMAMWPEPVVADNSGLSVATMSSQPQGFDGFLLGLNTVIYIATDEAGNTNACAFAVIVVDNEPPVLECPMDIVIPTQPGSDVGIAFWEMAVASDNSMLPVFQVASRVSGSVFRLEDVTTVVTIVGFDAAENRAECNFTVTVEDREVPFLVCPDDIIAATESGLPDTQVFWADPATSDNSRLQVDLQSENEAGDRFPLGTSTVFYNATDPAGNVNFCNFTIMVIDREAPRIQCPPSQVVQTDPGLPTGTAIWEDPIIMDNSMLDVTVVSTSESGASDFVIGPNIVTYTATDAFENSRTCSFRIVVQDLEPPVVTCPEDFSVDALPGSNRGELQLDPIVATDNSGQPLTLSSSRRSGNLLLLGDTNIVFTAIDETGNSGTCSFVVTVLDKEAPELTCPADIDINTESGLKVGIAFWTDPQAVDNSFEFIPLESDFESGDSFPIGTSEVTYTGADPSGNVGMCAFQVTVTDNQPPVISNEETGPGAPGSECMRRQCPPNIIVRRNIGSSTGTVNYDLPMVCDNSGGEVEVSVNIPPGEFPLGDTTIIITATDEVGNTDTCTFVITVLDPTIFVSGRVVTANTARGISGVTVGIGARTDQPPARPAPSTLDREQPTTTTTPRETTTDFVRRTKPRTTTAQRDTTTEAPTTTGRRETTTDQRRRHRRQTTEITDVQTNVDGSFILEVTADPDNYTLSVEVDGVIAEVDIQVIDPIDVRVVIAVPNIQAPDEWQFITSWVQDAVPAHNNFDANLQTSFEDECLVNTLGDFCFEGFNDAFLNLDFRNNRNGAGPETITVFAADSVYNHFVYGREIGSSFIGSQLQVHVYNIDGLVAKLHVSQDFALSGVPEEWRFWHTFSLDVVNGEVNVINQITCDPALSTGNDDVLALEDGERQCDAM